MENNLDQILELAKNCALEAGRAIKQVRESSIIKKSVKSNQFDIVTNADLEAESIIIKMIKEAYPTHDILSEESFSKISAEKLQSNDYWVIDPIDGTVNFAHGCLHVAISIAYAHKGEVLVGVVYAPFLNELFYSVKHRGAFLNGQKIQTSLNTDLRDCLVSTGFPYDRSPIIDLLLSNLKNLLKAVGGIRRFGAAAIDICWVACGRLDAHYELVLKPWDIAAANLIAREAGAVTGTLNSSFCESSLPTDLRSINTLVATKGIFTQLQGILAGYPSPSSKSAESSST